MKKVSINCKEINYIRFTLLDGRTLSGYRNRAGTWDCILHNIYVDDQHWEDIQMVFFRLE